MLLYLDNMPLTGPNLYKYTEFYPGVIGYSLVGVLCHQTAAVLSFFPNTVVTM